MSKIEQLLQLNCPDGVKEKKLKEIFKISRGRVMSKDYLLKNKGDFPVYSSQTANNGMIGSINTYDYDGEFLTWTTDGANAGTIFYRNGKFSITNVCGLLKLIDNTCIPKYIYYVLSTCMKNYVNYGMGNPKLMSNVVENITIPIPPLPIQQEIVTILDKFTALEAELEAELEARTRQYEYYRNQLLAFNENEIKLKSLEEICLKTSNIKWKDNIGNEFKYIDLSAVNRENNKIEELQIITSKNAPSRAQQIVKTDDIIFGTTRPTLKRYAVITDDLDGQICSTGFCVLRPNQELVLPRFLFYILKSSSFFNYVENNQEGAGYPSISNSKVKNFKYPIPPLEEQERILKILDQFDTLVNDIKIGLPAEIKARRAQYEYYRSKLLTFKKAS